MEILAVSCLRLLLPECVLLLLKLSMLIPDFTSALLPPLLVLALVAVSAASETLLALEVTDAPTVSRMSDLVALPVLAKLKHTP
jgi:hypothetical protein